MNVPPIDFERKGWINKPQKKERSVFDYCSGTMELYMDGSIIRMAKYTTKTNRRQILERWETLMRNHYSGHVFYIHLIPTTPDE